MKERCSYRLSITVRYGRLKQVTGSIPTSGTGRIPVYSPIKHPQKGNKADAEYRKSWGDPKLPKTQKTEQKPRQPIIQKKNREQKGRRAFCMKLRNNSVLLNLTQEHLKEAF